MYDIFDAYGSEISNIKVRCFLGLTIYCRHFGERFVKLAQSFIKLTCRKVLFKWLEAYE